MRKALITALVISASACTASAQDQKTDAPANIAVLKDQKSYEAKQAQDWQNTLVTELKLTDDQVKKITDLNKAFGDRRMAIEKNAELTDEAKAERKAALKKAQDAQFMKLLNGDQQAKYKELVEAKTKGS